MVIAFLVALNASSLCVARTDICAPAGSTLDGAIGQNGGQVVITPSKPLRALGAEFRAGTKVFVNVIPWWSSDKTAGAIVHVTGELTQETTISGARVAGTVRIGQLQGKKSPPQLVEATDFRGGKLSVGTAGTVDVGPGMKIVGNVDIGSIRLDVTSPKPIHALGLDLVAGTVRVEQSSTGFTIGGTLVRPQELGGVLVEQQLYATVEGGVPRFGSATLARTTKLKAIGLPDGEAPAGTVVRAAPGSTTLSGAGPFTVCGIALAAVPAVGQSAVTFSPSAPSHIAVNGALAGRDVDVGGGVHMTGPITLRYALGGCKQLGLEGKLSRAAEQYGLHFAANTTLAAGELPPGDPIVRGTLARDEVVDGLTVKGDVMVRGAAGSVHLLDGILAKAAPFEDWQVPAGTHVQRFGTGWSFTVPKGQVANAKAVHRGERVDNVTEARSDDSSTTFTLARPHTLKGTTLAMNSIGIDHQNGCVLGDLATPQRFGIFKIPKGGNATICGGTLVAAQGIYAVPSLQVGQWFATSAFAGDPTSPPAAPGPLGNAPTPPPPSTSAAIKGYWIQINSLCQGAAGIPLPPPEERWIWVDLKGNAPKPADRKDLASRATKAGTACPITPCCPP
jgi:hypothetical protein